MRLLSALYPRITTSAHLLARYCAPHLVGTSHEDTQFDDHSPFEEEPEEHRRQNQPDTLCETIKRLGYAQDNQVRLYGGVFDLVSDPASVDENFVSVDALDRKSGHVRRIRISPTIVQTARIKREQQSRRTTQPDYCCKIAISNNVGGVKHDVRTRLHALVEERHFALVDCLRFPTLARF